jgi:hypothetical protein
MPVPLASLRWCRALFFQKKPWWINPFWPISMIRQNSLVEYWIYSYTGGPTRGTDFRWSWWSGKGLRYVAAEPLINWVDTQSVLVAVKAHIHPYPSINPLQLNEPCPIFWRVQCDFVAGHIWVYMVQSDERPKPTSSGREKYVFDWVYLPLCLAEMFSSFPSERTCLNEYVFSFLTIQGKNSQFH